MSGFGGERRGGDEDWVKLAQLILSLRSKGVVDHDVLGAIETMPRRLFVPSDFHDMAFVDRPLPIECGQSASAPSVVARAIQAARVERHHKVLDIGTGSGYAAAVLSRLADHVTSIDRYRTLISLAEARFASLRARNVSLIVADGLDGLPRQAPFDRIFLWGAVPAAPATLIAQLKPDGVLIAPIGPPGAVQQMTRFQRTKQGLTSDALFELRVVSLVPGRAAIL